ncbi:replication protein [Limosilactobacillus vaginalis]|uniref:replication protein n=1 Tax=Limosilactobacillus vaginalis TaxID=1633 RepID=UPI0028CB611F|nr:replication protein [Limosilactobacillus vaginalis]
MSEKKQDERSRNWVVIVYPESAPNDWREILDNMHIQWIESPLHDKDVNPDGTVKKSHWHVVLAFGSKKSYKQVKEITDKLNSPIPQKVHNMKGQVRYLVHLDNPEKYQYPVEQVIAHGGIDVDKYFKATSGQKYDMIGEMIDYVRENNIVEMKDLIDYARVNRFDDWFPLLCDNSLIIMDAYIRSNRNSQSPRK